MKLKRKMTRGSLILEALIAIGIAAAIGIAVATLVVAVTSFARNSVEREEAIEQAREGISAMETISFSSLSPIAGGVISFASNTWGVSAGSPEVLPNGMTRSVDVVAVNRDGACLITEVGGTVDPDSLELVSTVSWTDVEGRAQTITANRLVTNWESPTGPCFLPTEASRIECIVDSAVWFGGKQLREFYLYNSSGFEAEVTKMTFTWDNDELIDQVFLGNDKVWSKAGPGTPLGSQVSGTELIIASEDIEGDTTVELPKTQFSGPMAGATVSLLLEFEDESTLLCGPVTPG